MVDYFGIRYTPEMTVVVMDKQTKRALKDELVNQGFKVGSVLGNRQYVSEMVEGRGAVAEFVIGRRRDNGRSSLWVYRGEHYNALCKVLGIPEEDEKKRDAEEPAEEIPGKKNDDIPF